MLNLSSHLQWFQAKIGSYDKQMWETSVEQRILQGLENRPKKDGSLHNELIDIDLVRGSTFSKAKPRHGLKSVIFNGLKRVILFPYYYDIWRDHLNKDVVFCVLVHYVIQLIQLTLYFLWSNSSEITLEEVLLPVVLALCLGILHTHIAPSTIKQRRKKTFSSSSNKTKSSSKCEGQPTVTESHLTNSLQPPAKDNLKSNMVHTCQERPVPGRSKKKIIFAKSTSHHSDFTDDEELIDIDKKTSQLEGYDGETETKDSSSSEPEEEVGLKNVDVDVHAGSTNKVSDINDPSCVAEVMCNGGVPMTILAKQTKCQDNGDRTAVYCKMKCNNRKCSQSEVATVTDEEDLKKFITAKNKHIPDPTPIAISKKEKDKTQWKASNSTSQKPYKLLKTRRQTLDWISNNSGISMDSVPVNKFAITESILAVMSEDTGSNMELNGRVTIQDTITDHSSDDNILSQNSIEMLAAKAISIANVLEAQPTEKCVLQEKSCHSQPHTPINHAGSRSRPRIEVRKISSANASPTPSRKNSTSFPNSGSLDRDMGLQSSTQTPIHNQTSLNGDQSGLMTGSGKVVDTCVSSEDICPRIAELNEDTITKCHKKREEYQQLFAKNANIGKSVSSTSSSRRGISDTKHSKMKRRHRDESKLVSSELKGNLRKEIIQSMSETEYDRMNSDVNSLCNSSSDGDDICPSVGINKSETEEIPETSELSKKEYEEHVVELGSNTANKNDNNSGSDDINRPVQPDDPLCSEINHDEPFVLWYKEAQGQGASGLVSCYVWENDQLKKTNLSLLDIGWSIIQAVKRHEQDKSYSSLGFFIIIALCFTPLFFRMYINRSYLAMVIDMSRHSSILESFISRNNSLVNSVLVGTVSNTSIAVTRSGFGNMSYDHVYSWSNDIMPLAVTSVLASEWPIRLIIVLGIVLRLMLYTMTFLLLCVAENSFEQRLQYAKHFCRLTSSRRARKYYLPHFRLNKLANIKCWLSLRSYLRKRGPQRSVESIISSAFYMLLAMLSLVCVNLLQSTDNVFIHRLINWDLMLCSIALGVFMMRFLVLGTKITKKYRNLSVIITEQINLFLAMQTRPHKKEELTLAHNVLRLAESLLKEVEGPFRVCGWSMNPFLYNILKVVILSVFSTILSESCGFKMKLYKIKINPANW